MKTKKAKKPYNINKLIALVFLLVILLGTVLLCLPIASRNGQCAGVKKALFTATSSTCVTGLVLADTYTQWSGFGQAVILCLIEIGGIGFMSAASFVIFTLKKKMNMSTQLLIAQTIGAAGIGDAIRVQKRILVWCFSAQGIGAAILTARFCFDFGFFKALKLGIFHSVSAFCNAGFDILGFKKVNGSLSPYATDPTVCLTIAFLIIFGGVGFLVWDEIFSKKPIKRWTAYSKLVLVATALLLILGTVFLGIAEWNNKATVGNMTFSQKILALFFQSTTTRTAGFAAIDQSAMTEGGKIVSIFLMFIGGSSGSTAGGLKTITFVLLVVFIYSFLRGKNNITIFYRSISSKQILSALTLFGVMISLVFIGSAVVCFTSPFSFTDGLFETVSALSTVGLTTGITPKMGIIAQMLMIVYMYFGRVGILTISLGFLNNDIPENKYRYAETNFLIG